MAIVGANSTVSTYRLATTSSKTQYSATATLSGIECYIQPVKPDVAVIYGDENAFTTFKLIADEALNISVSDKVVDQYGNEYIASGVMKYNNNIDTGDTTEVIMVKKYP